jgi:putative ABC transport system permease protein
VWSPMCRRGKKNVSLMSTSDLLFLYRARLRSRSVLVQELFAAGGIAVGVALLFASQVASTSLGRSISAFTSEIAGSSRAIQIQARGGEGMSEGVLNKVRVLPGVEQTLPLVEAQASVVGHHARASVLLVGANPHIARAGGPLLKRFSAAQLTSEHAVAMPEPLAQELDVGQLETIHLQIGANEATTLLGATLEEADIGGLISSPVVLTNIRYAQRLAGMAGKLSRIFVRPDRGREGQVRSELASVARSVGANVEPADYDGALFAVASAPARLAERLFAAISAIVAFVFALTAMLVTVPGRRRLIEDIRPQGATRAITIQIVLFDAAVLAVFGCVAGLVLGDVLSIGAFRSTPDYLSFAFPVGNDRVIEWQSVALSVGAGFVATLVGVLWPLRGVLRRSFAEDELSPRADVRHARVRTSLVGLTLIGLTTLLFARAPGQAVLASGTLLLAMLCLLPQLFDGLLSVFERGQSRLGDAATALTVVELRAPRSRVRSLAIAATAAIALFGVVQFQGAQGNLQYGLDESARGIDANAATWVTAAGVANTFATTPFKVDLRPLASTSGVDQIGVYRGGWLNWGKRRLWVLAPPSDVRYPLPTSQLLVGQIAAATSRIRGGGWAVLSQALADEHDLRVGSTFVLPSPRPITLRVAALSTNLAWPSGAVVMTSSDYAQAWGSSDASAYLVEGRPGTSPQMLRVSLEHALGAHSGLVVETRSERERRHFASSRAGLSRLTEIRILLLIAAVLAVAGAIAAMIWQRRDQIAFIKCDGYSKRVLWQWLCWESTLLVATGSVIGATFGLYGQLIASHYLATVTGFPVVYTTALLPAVGSLALLTLVTVAVLAVPGYIIARTPARAASPAY